MFTNQLSLTNNNQTSERNAKMESKKREVWMDKMREAAASGFIPYAQYMKPFVPEVKHDNWSSWRRLLEYEGYVVKEGDFGWIVVEKPKSQSIGEVEVETNGHEFDLSTLVETITAEVVKRLQGGAN